MTDSSPSGRRDKAGDRPTKPHRRKRWMFRALAVVLGLLCVVLLEAGLRVAHVGRETRLIVRIPESERTGRFRFNEHAEFPFAGRLSLQGPHDRPFQIPKPRGTYRIVVLGASTVVGFPYATELAFPRQMELFLQHQMPDRRIEVLNAGVTAIASSVVRSFVQQVERLQPDLIIVHAGHNEFYGCGGVASTATPASDWLAWLTMQTRRTRIGQLIDAVATPRPDASRKLVELLPRRLDIPWDHEFVQKAERRYRTELTRMRDWAQARAIPILFVPVACNLRSQGPVRDAYFANLPDRLRRRWETLNESIDRHIAQEEWEAALEDLDQAEALDDAAVSTSARLWWRKAQCLDALGRHAEAARAFRRARDLDGCRFRAPSTFRRIVSEVARGGGPQVHYFDLPAALEELGNGRVPGDEIFLEHVHYNLTGHRTVARLLARFICTHVAHVAWDDKSFPSDDEWDRRLGIMVQDQLAADSLTLELLQNPPFKEAFDVQQSRQVVLARIRDGFAKLDPIDRAVFSELPMSLMGGDLAMVLAESLWRLGHRDRALAMIQRELVRRPWSISARNRMAEWLFAVGETEKARRIVAVSAEWAPANEDVRRLKARLAE